LTFSSLNDIIKSTHAIDAKGGRLPIGIPGRLQIGMHGRLRRYPHSKHRAGASTVTIGSPPSRRKACSTSWRERTANAQKNSLKAIRFLIRFAISKGELAHDPTEGIDVLKADGPKSTGHMTWLAPQIAQHRQRHALGSFVRLALELLLNIAARRHDDMTRTSSGSSTSATPSCAGDRTRRCAPPASF
jgi:hypothetical protein